MQQQRVAFCGGMTKNQSCCCQLDQVLKCADQRVQFRTLRIQQYRPRPQRPSQYAGSQRIPSTNLHDVVRMRVPSGFPPQISMMLPLSHPAQSNPLPINFCLLRAPFGQYGPVAAFEVLSVYHVRLAPWTRGGSNRG